MKWTEFLESCQQWLDGRQQAGADAYWAVRRQGGNDYYVPQFEALAREARHAASIQYELLVPRPEWQGQEGGGNNCPLRYVTEADVQAARAGVAA